MFLIRMLIPHLINYIPFYLKYPEKCEQQLMLMKQEQQLMLMKQEQQYIQPKQLGIYCWKSVDDDIPIAALGDIHGDIEALISALKAGNLIELNQSKTKWLWKGGNTHLVILGDMVDRWREPMMNKNIVPHSVGEIMREEEIIQEFLNNLRKQATIVGGKIIKLAGNHEVMNVKGIFNTVSPFALQNQGGKEKRKQSFNSGGEMYKLLTDNWQDFHAIARVGRWIFVHGGFTLSLLKYIKPNSSRLDIDDIITEINTKFREGMLTGIFDENWFGPPDSSKPGSILWDRSQGNPVTAKRHDIVCGDFKELARIIGKQDLKLAVAHCNQLMNITRESKYFVPEISTAMEKDRTVHKLKLSGGKVEPYLCTESKSECQPGITYICPDDQGVGNIWRIDVAMSRSFDDIEKNVKFLSGNNDPEILKHFSSRRPQLLLTSADADPNLIQVCKSTTDLPRNTKCPLEQPCQNCQRINNLG